LDNVKDDAARAVTRTGFEVTAVAFAAAMVAVLIASVPGGVPDGNIIVIVIWPLTAGTVPIGKVAKPVAGSYNMPGGTSPPKLTSFTFLDTVEGSVSVITMSMHGATTLALQE
jgi:hypothetical protein